NPQVVVGPELLARTRDLDRERAREHVDPLFERVHVPVDAAAGELAVDDRMVHGPLRAVEERATRQPLRVLRERAGVGRRLAELADDVHGLGRELGRRLGRIGERRGERRLANRLELGRDARLELVERLLGDAEFAGETRAGNPQRIALAPAVELALRPVAPGIAARVADEAVGQGLEEERPAARACLLECGAGCVPDSPQVVAVDDLRRDLHRLGTGERRPAGDVRGARVLAVDVVLADIERRQREDLREVQALVEVGLVDGAVAEERDRRLARPAEGERRPGRGRDRAADDAEAADQAVLEVDDVHRARAAAADPGRAAEQLVEELLRLEPERERVAVPAVRPADAVAVAQAARDADLDRLLAGAEVRRPVNVPLQEERLHELFEAADELHAPVEIEGLLDVGRDRGLERGAQLAHGVGVSSWRSAPRTYVRPVTRSSSAGNLVRISQPSGVTSTSSSIRAAERPSRAGQYVSSAKTIPSSISTGSRKEWRREIIGDS